MDEGCVIVEQMTISDDGTVEVQSSTTYTTYGMLLAHLFSRQNSELI